MDMKTDGQIDGHKDRRTNTYADIITVEQTDRNKERGRRIAGEFRGGGGPLILRGRTL